MTTKPRLNTVRHIAQVEQQHSKEDLLGAMAWMRSALNKIDRDLESSTPGRAYIQDKGVRDRCSCPAALRRE